jgi:hypothetical protein
MTDGTMTPSVKGGGRKKKAPLPIGRHTLLTPEVEKKIIDAVRAGAFLSVAARYAGVGNSTLMLWMRKGRECTNRKGKDAIYLSFLEKIEEAEAASEVAANLQWRAAWAKDWHAAEKWLQSRYPERYGLNRDPNATSAAFAGININIGATSGQSSTNSGQQPPIDVNVALETLIEGNPRLLGATMHLFDEIDAIYAQNSADDTFDPQLTPQTPEIRQVVPYVAESDDFDVIEGTFEPVSDQNDD